MILPSDDQRPEPPFVAGERPMLEAWLEWQRATLMWKCGGLDDDQLRRRSLPPSSMSLLGLVRHLTDVERYWFRRTLDRQDGPPHHWDTDGDADADFNGVDQADVAADLALYWQEVESAREIAARHDLDAAGTRHGRPVSLRWIYVHLISEYARHNGHADLLREGIDGATGE